MRMLLLLVLVGSAGASAACENAYSDFRFPKRRVTAGEDGGASDARTDAPDARDSGAG